MERALGGDVGTGHREAFKRKGPGFKRQKHPWVCGRCLFLWISQQPQFGFRSLNWEFKGSALFGNRRADSALSRGRTDVLWRRSQVKGVPLLSDVCVSSPKHSSVTSLLGDLLQGLLGDLVSNLGVVLLCLLKKSTGTGVKRSLLPGSTAEA